MATKQAKKRNKTVIVKVRVTQEQARVIVSRANAFFRGNVSRFVRHCVDGFRKP